MLDLTPAECLVVEDAHAGVEAGAAGGFDTACVGDARTCDSCSYIIGEVLDVLRVVGK
jgi:beta-phosphoglucomutase-like phosphatase (HAD superfamily)